MALAIDTLPLAQLIPRLQSYLDHYSGRFQIHRVCAHATVIHDGCAFRRLLKAHDKLADQKALDWQAEQGDDLPEGKVFHHLQHQVATSPLLLRAFTQTERTNATTTLVASALSPSFTARTQGRPASSFRGQSLRCSCLQRNQVIRHAFAYSSAIHKVFPNAGEHYAWVYFPDPGLKINWAKNTGYKPFVVWNLQLDVVDIDSIITTFSCPGKRPRTAMNQFLHVSPVAVEPAGNQLPEAKKFRGVRHRIDRKRWVAEMKPPKCKNKVSFGDFKSEIQAARAVDAAFHHYGKTHLLNFPDSTPRILSSRSRVAGLNGLDAKAKLRLVKEQAKWLASIASNSVPSETPDSSCNGFTLAFRSLSEISSSFSSGGGADEEADDGSSQPEYTMAEEGMVPWSPGSLAQGSAGNSMETYSEFSTGMLKSFVNSSQSSMEFLMMSPPAPMLYMATSSPSNSLDSIGDHCGSRAALDVYEIDLVRIVEAALH